MDIVPQTTHFASSGFSPGTLPRGGRNTGGAQNCRPAPPRVFLFLQGPNGSFFRLLAGELERLGHTCLRINLCASDAYFWKRPGASDYRGSRAGWPEFLFRFLRENGVTDILLNGEQRDYHRSAILLAKQLGIAITATDFGYLRSDWIVLERDGHSGSSHFPKDPGAIRQLAKLVPKCDFSWRFGQDFRDMASAEIMAGIVDVLFGFRFPYYSTHHLHPPIRCGFYTARRKLKARWFGRKTKRLIETRISEAPRHPFFLFPMQLESDAQIRMYSRYPDMATPLQEVIFSFAGHAPENSRLLVKVHPLDVGIVDWKRVVRKLAILAGVEDRVDFLDVGLLDDIIKASSGIVTVNSTVGIIGLRFEKHVKVLGQAIYDIPGITFQGPLEKFWKAGGFFDREFCAAYLRALGGCLHVRGNFYGEQGVVAAARAAAERLHLNLVNRPADPENPAGGVQDRF